MIRNTRAVAKINIPPRFAETVRVEPTGSEKELYERISHLGSIHQPTDGTGNKLLLKTPAGRSRIFPTGGGIDPFAHAGSKRNCSGS
jgi:hypothetical protein